MTTQIEASPRPAEDWPRPLYDLTMAVAAASRPEEIFEAALTALERSLGVSRASVLLFDRDGVMRFKAWRGLSDEYRAAVEGHSPWTPETTDAAPVLVEDVLTDASLDGLRPTITGEGIRALAFVPLALGPRLFGKFMLYYEQPHVFSAQEVLTAQTVAAHVAFAIDQQGHRDSERRYRDLLQSLGVAVYTTDAAGRITYYNDEAVALWGRAPVVGHDLWCGSWKLSWEDGTAMAHEECPMAITIRERRPVRGVDAVSERPDGTRVNFTPYPTPIFDASGELAGAVNVLVDITRRKQVEAALEEKEARLVLLLGEQASLLAARDETIRLYEAVQAQLTSLIEASGTLISAETREGAVRAILQIAVALLGADAYAMWQFAPERDRWEIALSHGLSDEYLAASSLGGQSGQRELLEPMVVEDVYAEPRLEALLDRYRAERVCSLFVAPLRTGPDARGTLAFYYREPHRFSELEVRVGVALANLASASLAATRLFQENERARHALERANAALADTAAELRLANAAKDEFLGLVSHELKTPLTTIRGNADVLFRTKARLDPEARDGALRDIVAESERLHRIIENLLLLARVERGHGPEAEPLLAIRVVQRVVERHKQHHPGRAFEIHNNDAPRPVVFSEAFLEQVMENLISNAEKYSPPGAPIVIDFDRRTEEVRMRVLDRGVGVAPEEIDRLFDPFYRSTSAKRRAEGLGIGLTVCKRLVEAYGGRMWAKSRPGGGAEFGFALPVSTEDES